MYEKEKNRGIILAGEFMGIQFKIYIRLKNNLKCVDS